MKKIVIGSDICGFELKNAIVAHLEKQGYDITDLGTKDINVPIDYFVVGDKLGEAVSDGDYDRGILVSGFGIGDMLMANKYPNVLCTTCASLYMLKKAREMNNINVLSLAAYITAKDLALRLVDEFLGVEWRAGLSEEDKILAQKGFDYTVSRAREIRNV